MLESIVFTQLLLCQRRIVWQLALPFWQKWFYRLRTMRSYKDWCRREQDSSYGIELYHYLPSSKELTRTPNHVLCCCSGSDAGSCSVFRRSPTWIESPYRDQRTDDGSPVRSTILWENIVLTSVDRVYLGKKANKNEKELYLCQKGKKTKVGESWRNRRTKKIKNEKWNTFEVFRK